jgi:hypothetical protein
LFKAFCSTGLTIRVDSKKKRISRLMKHKFTETKSKL